MINQTIEDNFFENYQAILDDIVAQAVDSTEFDDAVARYSALVRPYVDTYQHHQGSAISDDELQKRFLHETALLHTITIQFQNWIDCIYGEPLVVRWAVNQSDSFYDWYSPSEYILKGWKQVPIDDVAFITPELGVQLVDQADLLLSRVGRRYLGEFYTPVSLTNHLLDLSNFSPQMLLAGAHVVDPACGSGNILAQLLVRILGYAHENDLPTSSLVNEITSNIHGYDIQPFAVTLTRTVLLYITFLYLDVDESQHLDALSFHNVELVDPLASQENTWRADGLKFKYIVGNPPFMAVKKDHIAHIEAYEDILSGHPNLYTMFLWWAVRSAANDGMISFLLPQSMLAGLYFTAIRTRLNAETQIHAVTRLLDRTGVVGEADQQMMVLALKVTRNSTSRSPITLRVVRNGDAITAASPITLPYNSVVSEISGKILWHISDNLLDFEIMASLQAGCMELGDCDEIQIGNGSFVWNQHKELVHQTAITDAIPLISSVSICKFGFSFPYYGKYDSRTRQFARVVGEKIYRKKHSGRILLIKRTTPRKVGRRLIAGMPAPSFYADYPEYFLENHVNFIKQTAVENDETLLYGLLGWLNSDVVNFIFQLRNGSTQVSVFELKLLPANLELIAELAPIVQCILATSDVMRQNQLEAEMNQTILHWFNLGTVHEQRMKMVLKLREQSVKSKG